MEYLQSWCADTRYARERVRTHEGSFMDDVPVVMIDGFDGLLPIRDISHRRERFP